MLGKLLKHELKNTWKLCVVLLLTLGALTFFGSLALSAPFLKIENMENYLLTGQDLVSVVVLILCFMGIVVITAGLHIYIGIRFYRTMFSNQGYLTHTLPVTPGKLLLSQTLSGCFWLFCFTLATIGSTITLVGEGARQVLLKGADISIWQAFYEFRRMFQEIAGAEMQVAAGDIDQVFGAFAGLAIVGTFTALITIFTATALGHLSHKHKILMSVIAYVVLTVAEQVVSTIVMVPLILAGILNESQNQMRVIAYSWIIAGVVFMIVNVVLYFISYGIISRKLNLE